MGLNTDFFTKVNERLRYFNEWKDSFFIEVSPLLLLVGFVFGTVDVLTDGKLQNMPWFSVSWAIIQALSIDGLFFAVWSKVSCIKWSWKSAPKGLFLIVVGLLLSIVAGFVNNILNYEELNNLTSISAVMLKIGINSEVFGYCRSFLVVLVAILVAIFAAANRRISDDDDNNGSNVPVSVAPNLPASGNHQVIEMECHEVDMITSEATAKDDKVNLYLELPEMDKLTL